MSATASYVIISNESVILKFIITRDCCISADYYLAYSQSRLYSKRTNDDTMPMNFAYDQTDVKVSPWYWYVRFLLGT